MSLDNTFYKEEIRCDFLVTSKRKKIWATELQILEKFDAVCQKYNLKYFAEYGTLLGAVRHQGFIPWDDDIDVAMFRDDYQKLKEIAATEFTEPYFFQDAYTDDIGIALSKIRDSRTTAIEYPDQPDFHQGIFIDIYPLDTVPDESGSFTNIFELEKMMWLTIANSEELINSLKNASQASPYQALIIDLLKMPPRQRMQTFELFCLSHFGKSQNINFITDEIINGSKNIKKSWYDDVIYLPFEHLQIPVPAEYDKLLTLRYGNYHEYIQGGSAHENIILDPDKPYLEYFNQ